LVRQIVNFHGGAVHAHSEGQGHGSEFLVRLPLSRTAVATESASNDPTAIPPRRIVVVEDQLDTREMMTLLLTARGHEVTEAEDGPTGIHAIQRVRPDAALVDIGLPTMTGYDVARRIREDPALDNVRLIALTGYGAAEDVEAARDAGFDHHLTKPATTDRIESILAEPAPGRD
jgi:CheY-like chemotaxis protein